MCVDDGDGAASGVGEEAGGGKVGGSAVVLGGRPRQHAVPCGGGALVGRPLHRNSFDL